MAESKHIESKRLPSGDTTPPDAQKRLSTALFHLRGTHYSPNIIKRTERKIKGKNNAPSYRRKIKPLEALLSFEWISYRANVYKANRTHGNEPERASTNREKRSSLYPTLPPLQMAHFARSQQSEFTPKGENSKPN